MSTLLNDLEHLKLIPSASACYPIPKNNNQHKPGHGLSIWRSHSRCCWLLRSSKFHPSCRALRSLHRRHRLRSRQYQETMTDLSFPSQFEEQPLSMASCFSKFGGAVPGRLRLSSQRRYLGVEECQEVRRSPRLGQMDENVWILFEAF